jgi:xylulose-5-phosphate/fructose-6-phosphate phosphoketolase
MDAAVKHCTKGVGIWDWASTDAGSDPDVVMACAGDIATMEALAATAILRERFPDLKMWVVVDIRKGRATPSSISKFGCGALKVNRSAPQCLHLARTLPANAQDTSASRLL